MDPAATARSADQAFFTALIERDTNTLDSLLARDFLLIDVLRGSEVSKADLLGALDAGLVRFESIEAGDARVRVYDGSAIVTGSTRMTFAAGEQRVTVRSRYTHVHARVDGDWKLVSAQGTPVVE